MAVIATIAIALLPTLNSAPIRSLKQQAVAASGSWTTYHHDDAHTGYDASTPQLSSASTGWVSSTLDGQVYAEPLIFNGVVYAATLNNSVYALNQSTGAVIWSKNVGAPQTGGWTCGNISPTGILGTPVIDTTANRIYVVAELTGTTPTYHLFGLDLANSGNIVLDTPLAPGGFDWHIEQERGALALHNGFVYVPFGGRLGDCGGYHGYVFAVPTNGSGAYAWYLTPSTGSGIWGAGGPAIDDASGNVFVATGNAVSSGCNTVDQNDAVLNLNGTTMALQGWFMPSDWQNGWCSNDQDLGSAGPVLISSSLLFQAGKHGGGFLLNPANLGGVDGQLFPTPAPATYSQANVCFGNTGDATFGSFAYAAPFVYVECEGRGLVALNVNTGTPSFTPCGSSCGAPDWSAGGGTTFGPPIIAGGAVWVTDTGGGTGLYAFNMTTGAQIFHSASFGANRFVTPAEAGGQVFVPSGTLIRSFNMNFLYSLQSLGGNLTSGPGSSSWGSTDADAFMAGSNHGMWHTQWNGTAWTWEYLGGYLTADPGAASWGTNRIDTFVRGTDNQLWHIYWNGTSWVGWEPLGGILTSGPGATSQAVNTLDVVVRGTDNGLWHRAYNTTTGWQGWESLGGGLTSDPAVASWAAGRLDVFLRGGDGGLWHRAWDSTAGWHAWEWLGGKLLSAPSASSCASGSLDVWAIGTDGGLWRRSFASGAWGTWQSLGGQWTSRPSASCRPGTTTIDVYERGSDNSLWHLGF